MIDLSLLFVIIVTTLSGILASNRCATYYHYRLLQPNFYSKEIVVPMLVFVAGLIVLIIQM